MTFDRTVNSLLVIPIDEAFVSSINRLVDDILDSEGRAEPARERFLDLNDNQLLAFDGRVASTLGIESRVAEELLNTQVSTRIFRLKSG